LYSPPSNSNSPVNPISSPSSLSQISSFLSPFNGSSYYCVNNGKNNKYDGNHDCGGAGVNGGGGKSSNNNINGSNNGNNNNSNNNSNSNNNNNSNSNNNNNCDNINNSSNIIFPSFCYTPSLLNNTDKKSHSICHSISPVNKKIINKNYSMEGDFAIGNSYSSVMDYLDEDIVKRKNYSTEDSSSSSSSVTTTTCFSDEYLTNRNNPFVNFDDSYINFVERDLENKNYLNLNGEDDNNFSNINNPNRNGLINKAFLNSKFDISCSPPLPLSLFSPVLFPFFCSDLDENSNNINVGNNIVNNNNFNNNSNNNIDELDSNNGGSRILFKDVFNNVNDSDDNDNNIISNDNNIISNDNNNSNENINNNIFFKDMFERNIFSPSVNHILSQHDFYSEFNEEEKREGRNDIKNGVFEENDCNINSINVINSCNNEKLK
jgi:hypothetical protein